MMPLRSRLRLIWLWLNAGRPQVARTLRGDDQLPPPRWTTNPVIGKKLLKRRFVFAGCDVEMAGRIAWQVDSANSQWHREFYAFRWLEDIASTGSPKMASSFAREFINNFILEADDVLPDAFSPGVQGVRLAEWLHHRRFLLKSGSLRFQRRFVRAVVHHIFYLYRQLEHADPAEAVLAIKGLLAASVYLPMLRLPRPPLLVMLEAMLDEIILADGVHASGVPESHLHLLRHLIEIQDLLLGVGEENLPLEKCTMAMGSSLRFFCHGDGRLALFGGALMEEPHIIAQAISRSDNGEPVPAHMDASGFFRLERGHTCLLMSGQPQRPQHASSFASFEFSDGSERFVVNCGGYRGTSQSWRSAAMLPGAFSTLSLDALEGVSSPLRLPPHDDDAPLIKPDSFQNDGSQLIARTARLERVDGAEGAHEREIRLNTNGQQFSGIDSFRLARAEPGSALRLSLRFHLHPDIRCQRQKDGTISLSSVAGAVWYFTSTMPKATHIEESVYLGYYGKPQKTLQIVISTEVTTKLTEFRWSFTRQNETI
jgi:uncharacterized heparinase superfamily protein